MRLITESPRILGQNLGYKGDQTLQCSKTVPEEEEEVETHPTQYYLMLINHSCHFPLPL